MKSESGFPPDAAFSVRKSGVRLVLSERFLQSARESSRPNATPRRTRASLGCLRDLVFGAAERREEGGRGEGGITTSAAPWPGERERSHEEEAGRDSERKESRVVIDD